MNNVTVKLSKASEEYIKRIFGQYTDADLPSTPEGRFVLHLYATSDTTREDGQLDGYQDSLFFDIHVYDQDSKRHGVIARDCDGLSIECPCSVRIFKDGSTMLFFSTKVQLDIWQDTIVKAL